MAWCPNCKNEYRDGITVCPDCNVELLEELSEEQTEDYVLLFQTDDKTMKSKVTSYLSHCGIHLKEEADSVFVPKKEAREAMKEMRTVLYVNAEQDGPTAELDKTQAEKESSASVYVEAKDRYQEYHSSGFMFLAFAAALFVFGLCNMFGILSVMASPLSLVLITLMVVGLVFVGISSLKKAASLKEEAANEETQSEQLRAYLAKEFPKNVLDAMAEPDMSEEILYLKQLDAMKEKLLEEYPDLVESYIDALLEDYCNSL